MISLIPEITKKDTNDFIYKIDSQTLKINL